MRRVFRSLLRRTLGPPVAAAAAEFGYYDPGTQAEMLKNTVSPPELPRVYSPAGAGGPVARTQPLLARKYILLEKYTPPQPYSLDILAPAFATFAKDLMKGGSAPDDLEDRIVGWAEVNGYKFTNNNDTSLFSILCLIKHKETTEDDLEEAFTKNVQPIPGGVSAIFYGRKS